MFDAEPREPISAAITAAVDPAYRHRFQTLYAWLQVLAREPLSVRPQAVLSPASLVRAAYRDFAGHRLDLGERARFMALAAQALRCVLIDHIRARAVEPPLGALARVRLIVGIPLDPRLRALDLIALEQSLAALEQREPRLATVAECRLYAGLELQEIAVHLGVTARTVQRDWQKARAFLLAHVGEPG